MDKNTHNKGLGYKTKGWLWGWSLKRRCLVHPPQLQRTSHMARGHTNLTHVDIQGEPGGDPGMQQQRGSIQEI